MKQSEISNIIQRVKNGDHHSFSLLVEEYKDMIYSLCLKISQSTEDAEEIAQDSFVKAFQGIHRFKGKSKFSTWLYQIAYFTAINHLRKKKITTTNYADVQAFAADSSILEEIQQTERKYYLNKALELLNHEERALITLYYMEENSIEEIVAIIGISKSNTKVKLHRTRKKLFGIMQHLLKNEINSLV